MTLTATGPAGTEHDPFAGSALDDGAALSLPLDRYTALGADEVTLADLQTYFASLTRTEQREAVEWHEAQTDEELGASLTRFVDARDAFAALGGLTDEERAQLDALTDDERAALAALTPEERTALSVPADTATPPADGPAATPEGEQTAEGGSGPQNAAEPLFATTQIGDLTIKEVEALIAAGTVTAAEALTAELARGAAARTSLVDRLSKVTSE